MTTARVLIVDDSPTLLRIYERMLAGAGYEIHLCNDGDEAEKAILRTHYDVVVSDIRMPKLGGMELLRRVRGHDADLPVVLITGSPDLETAIRAVQDGALRYLQKPICRQDLRDVTGEAVRKRAALRARTEALRGVSASDAELAASFARALESMYVAFQPIVSWSRRAVYGYEALLRSREPSLPNPPAVLEAAERLDRLHDLGRRVRSLAAAPMRDAPPGTHLFVNLHAHDLLDEEMHSPDAALARVPDVVLEITERASLHAIRDLRDRVRALRSRGFKIAVDDLGAGYAGLTSVAQLEPEVTKLDMSLVRDVHKSETKLTLVRTVLAMCKGIGSLVVAEGIETAEERDALASVGCDLMQGYFFAKPGPPFPAARWE